MPEIEKNPGPDWEVHYWIDEGPEVMSVFGAATIELAIQEARFSLGSQADYRIIAVAMKITREKLE